MSNNDPVAKEDVVWESTVDDGAYRVTVERLKEYGGILTVLHTDSSEVILTEEVGLSYGALFGPDVADVADWQDRAIVAIDDHIAKGNDG